MHIVLASSRLLFHCSIQLFMIIGFTDSKQSYSSDIIVDVELVLHEKFSMNVEEKIYATKNFGIGM